ncbi:MAG: hypothetical protein KY476_00025 [Planctomycetes bacterium]|nr:hypothetical protein [Planctomycetota bacterium]
MSDREQHPSGAGGSEAGEDSGRVSVGDDCRLYVPDPEGFEARLKQGWEKEYCYLQNPDEDHFHLLMNGEIYLERGGEKYCLRCALRHGLVTTERLNWQRGSDPAIA